MKSQDSNSTERKRVILVGQVNSGKSTLFNRLLRQQRSLVSDQPGTTTDSVEKLLELPNVGPIVLIDTPGVADETPLGAARQQVTMQALSSADLILYLLSSELSLDTPLISLLQKSHTPVLPLIARADLPEQQVWLRRKDDIARCFGMSPLRFRRDSSEDLKKLLYTMKRTLAEREEQSPPLLGNLCKAGDLVLLVMPQDREAPVGRLILPQVQTIRALLDRDCHTLCVTPDELSSALKQLVAPPRLIITDSQAFATVERLIPEGALLTSFSILMSAQRGDLKRLIAGATSIGSLTPTSRILIAEACTHAPEGEDIGTVKIPNLLRQHISESIIVEHISGRDFPDDLTPYNLVIHCGGCMVNRRTLISRQDLASAQQVPMTNYGLAIAYLTGILSRVSLPL